MKEFENSYKGLAIIIIERKLYKKKSYLITIVLIFLINVFLYLKNDTYKLDYFTLLKNYVETFLPAFITFCGFTMTAYSLVVGFLNYGVFKKSLETWYNNKIEEENNNKSFPKFTLYQKGIALFALSVLMLLLNVILFLFIKFIISLNIEIKSDCFDSFNAIFFLVVTLLTSLNIIIVIHNIVNIFTFSQSLNQLTYIDQLEKRIK